MITTAFPLGLLHDHCGAVLRLLAHVLAVLQARFRSERVTAASAVSFAGGATNGQRIQYPHDSQADFVPAPKMGASHRAVRIASPHQTSANRRRARMARWFRSYVEKLHSPKVLRLSDSLYRGWDKLLCVACQYDGVLPSVPDLALLLRRTPAATAKLVEALIEARLLDRTERGIEPHDWNVWQYQSDNSAERTRRHRERQRAAASADTVTASGPDADSQPEPDRGSPFKGFLESDCRTSPFDAARASQEGSAHDGERKVAIRFKRVPA
jgi:hypothetical protein